MKLYCFAGVGIEQFEVLAASRSEAFSRAYWLVGELPSDENLFLVWSESL